MNGFWNTQKINSCLSAQLLNPLVDAEPLSITHLTTDSRAVTPGCAFIALKGDSFDGHHFIPEAIQKGALAIIYDSLADSASPAQNCRFFKVKSSLQAIRELAHFYRQTFSIPMIAVVGSVGKTTTKELISSILKGKFKSVHKTEGSQNGFLGIPLTLLALNSSHDIAVIEVGIDDIGAMEQHLPLVAPSHVILTAIGPEHLHQLKTLEMVAEEELKAFDYALKKKLPLAINLSDEWVSRWYQKNKTFLSASLTQTYSMNSDSQADFVGHYLPEKTELEIQHAHTRHHFSLPLPGEHHAHNLLAAITLASFFHLSINEMKNGLSQFKTAYGRTEIYHLNNGIEIIGDYYNSNPTSVKAGLKLLTEKKCLGQTHAILGDMLELGEQEELFHRALAQEMTTHQVHSVWLYGNRMKWLSDELNKIKFLKVLHFSDPTELTAHLIKSIKPNDRILIKGSRGMKMESILKALLQVLDH